jgi:hypothetical protein
MNILTHLGTFAQEEYNPYYIPTHFVNISNRYMKISNITPVLWHIKKAHHKALLLRNERNDTRVVST